MNKTPPPDLKTACIWPFGIDHKVVKQEKEQLKREAEKERDKAGEAKLCG